MNLKDIMIKVARYLLICYDGLTKAGIRQMKMRLKLKFLGASKNVTGSRFLLEINEKKLLIDCGLHQERELKERDWGPFPVAPNTIDAVLLTHPHLDHSGFLPKLVRLGYKNPVYCTEATADIAKVMLLDSAKIQMIDAENKKQRHEKKQIKAPHPEIPLYTTDDAEACFPLLSPVKYLQTVDLGDGVTARFHNAGHVLGAAMIEIVIEEKRDWRRFVFSGDIGRWNRPIIHDPSTFEQADYVITESTYGERALPPGENLLAEFVEIVNSTLQAGGNLVIPSFALERAQDILYYLFRALDARLIPPVKVYLDSPMAADITRIFRNHAELFDDEMQELIRQQKTPFHFPGLRFVEDAEESRQLSTIKGPVIIIAGSGMATGGRIKFHLAANISRPESTIMFAGYQAVGTLGRNIVDRPEEVRILGEYYPVKARVIQVHGFSSHADREQLLRWNYALKQPPRQVFVVHGEEAAAGSLAETIRREKGWRVTVPGYLDEFELD